MSLKRQRSPDLITNPYIKKRNLGWTLETPLPDKHEQIQQNSSRPDKPPLTTAAVESGSETTTDHLTLFVTTLSNHTIPSSPRLPISSYKSLFEANAGNSEGAHFVIHQHDHPIAGTHYDLRLQINETSSASWAIMYGLPGDPNSVRLNRNATETRIHCLWNHLIETASSATGSLLIWDTGTYTIIPRTSKHAPLNDPDSPPSSPSHSTSSSQQALLHAAFQDRKIRLRLHSAKLPDPYVLNLRLTKSEDAFGRAKMGKTPSKRRKKGNEKVEETSDEGDKYVEPTNEAPDENVSATDREIRDLEDEQVRTTNAYPGAVNTIGSIHQRKWYLSLDRAACGFLQGEDKKWHPDPDARPQGDDKSNLRHSWPFYIRGVEHERSVVSGRKGEDILQDEGVTGFVQRKGWKPVLN